MKTIFIVPESNFELDKSVIEKYVKDLPENIAICYSIQFKKLADEIKQIIEGNKKVLDFVQVLGCSKPIFNKKVEAILLIGEGKFHSVSLAYETKLPVYLFSYNKFTKVSKEDIEKLEKKEKASYLNYLNQDKIGILVSTKPGQERLKRALNFSKKLKEKRSYPFIANNLNVSEFENFGIKSWVNTSCPRMDLNDSFIININKVEK